MGRLIILQFEDSNDGKRWLKEHDSLGEYSIVGEYYIPPTSIYCKCNQKTRVQAFNWRRHKKFGLFICKQCGLPSRHWRLGLMARLQEALGNNLLK